MNETLKTILDMDKKAQLKVEEAEAYRREAVAGLSTRKSAITEDETRKAKESAVRRSDRRKAESDKMLSEIKVKNEKLLKEMNALYQKNADKWIDDIVSNATK